jgi:hypothetical protein
MNCKGVEGRCYLSGGLSQRKWRPNLQTRGEKLYRLSPSWAPLLVVSLKRNE